MKVKSILLAIALTFGAANFSYAQQLEVFLTHGGGLLDRICRKMFSEYEQKFNEPVKINVKTGADGILAAREMSNNSSKTKILCHGSSVWVQNRFVHKDKDIGVSDKSILVKYSDEPTLWYVPNSVKGINSWETLMAYLKSFDRPIKVGGFTGVHRAQITWLAKEYNLNLVVVPFKKGPEILPALAKGDLDLALDPGVGYKAAKAGKFQIVGYNMIKQNKILKDKPNFDSVNQNMKTFGLWLGLTVNADMDPMYKDKIADRLKSIITTDSFKEFAEIAFAPVDWTPSIDAEVFINKQIKDTEKLLN